MRNIPFALDKPYPPSILPQWVVLYINLNTTIVLIQISVVMTQMSSRQLCPETSQCVPFQTKEASCSTSAGSSCDFYAAATRGKLPLPMGKTPEGSANWHLIFKLYEASFI